MIEIMGAAMSSIDLAALLPALFLLLWGEQ